MRFLAPGMLASLMVSTAVCAQSTAQPDSTSAPTEGRAAPTQSRAHPHKPASPAPGRSGQANRQPYTQATGKKPDSSTVCTTPHRTQRGQIDCGLTGDAATNGHIVTKPR